MINGAPSDTSPRRGCGGKAAARTLSLACVASEAACYSDRLLARGRGATMINGAPSQTSHRRQ